MTCHVPPVVTISSTSSTNQQSHSSKQKSHYITCLLKTLQCLSIVFVVKISKAFNETSKFLTFLPLFPTSPLSSYAPTRFHFLWMAAYLPRFFLCFPIACPPAGGYAHILGLSLNTTSYANHPWLWAELGTIPGCSHDTQTHPYCRPLTLWYCEYLLICTPLPLH